MKTYLNSFQKLAEIAKFFLVGIIATLIHAFIYLITIKYLDKNAHIANICGFLIAFAFSYIGQKYFTFSRSSSKSSRKELSKFLSVSLTGLCLNSFWVLLVNNIFNVNPAYATFGIVIITPVLTFFALKHWVFKG